MNTPPTKMTKEVAEQLALTLNSDQEDNWTYHVNGIKIGNDAVASYYRVSVRDEAKHLVGYL